MGRQVRFRLGDHDVELLEDVLRRRGAVFIPWRTLSPDLAPQPTLAPPPGLALDPWIARAEDVGTLRRELVPAQGYWTLVAHGAPVIDFTRGKLRGGPMSVGRIHYETTRLIGGRLAPMPDSFLDWADSIATWVRRNFVRDASQACYVGPHAAKLLRVGDGG